MFVDPEPKHPSHLEIFADKYQRFLRRHFMQNATMFSNHAWPVIGISKISEVHHPAPRVAYSILFSTPRLYHCSNDELL